MPLLGELDVGRFPSTHRPSLFLLHPRLGACSFRRREIACGPLYARGDRCRCVKPCIECPDTSESYSFPKRITVPIDPPPISSSHLSNRTAQLTHALRLLHTITKPPRHRLAQVEIQPDWITLLAKPAKSEILVSKKKVVSQGVQLLPSAGGSIRRRGGEARGCTIRSPSSKVHPLYVIIATPGHPLFLYQFFC